MSLVELEVDDQGGPVWLLRLNRPEALNALSRDLLRELEDHLARAAESNLRALVITGSGKAFCSGADLKERKEMSDRDVQAFLLWMGRVQRGLEELPCPTIAAINGLALGGGLELALCCDLRVALESASMALPETSLGIIPGAGGTQRLPRIIGMARATEMILTARRLSAAEALQWGLINALYPDTELEAFHFEMARRIRAAAPVAIRQARRSLREGFGLPLNEALTRERYLYAATLATEDRMEALLAFQEKRKPVFKGR
ncbi:MAG: enoyl-CoA hydratase/isomerase family protein [Spirochaetales bacterium]|nr:enoyl-CoA hydratase/isomerase family protein [Spirochaetales bacterium]